MHLLLGVQMVVRRLFLLPKLHAPSRPVRAKATGFNTRKLDVPLRLDLVADGLGKALDRPLARAIDREQRHAALPADGRDLLDFAALRFLLAHRLERVPGHFEQAEEVDFHLFARLGLADGFEFAAEAVAGVVADDVDAAEVLEGGGEGLVDGSEALLSVDSWCWKWLGRYS